MITELRIEGFKSFGTPPVRVALGPLNFVVGANASGKSNLMAALRFLQLAITQNVDYAINEFGGVAEVENKILRQRDELKLLSIELALDDAENTTLFPDRTPVRVSGFRFRMDLDLRSAPGRPRVAREELYSEIIVDGKQYPYSLKREGGIVRITDPVENMSLSDGTERVLPVPEQDAARLVVGVGLFSLPCVILRTIVERWRFYNIDPKAARRPARETPDAGLGESGENLAVVLHAMETANDGDALNAVVQSLRSAVPGFKGLLTKQMPVEGTWAFQLVEEKIRGAINPDGVSDGTVRLLALSVIANWVTRRCSLVVIEEPENGLHPHLSEHVVQMLRDASGLRQVVATTHNPAFLDNLEPSEVLLCDKKMGFTRVKRASDIRLLH